MGPEAQGSPDGGPQIGSRGKTADLNRKSAVQLVLADNANQLGKDRAPQATPDAQGGARISQVHVRAVPYTI